MTRGVLDDCHGLDKADSPNPTRLCCMVLGSSLQRPLFSGAVEYNKENWTTLGDYDADQIGHIGMAVFGTLLSVLCETSRLPANHNFSVRDTIHKDDWTLGYLG
eukprot:Gregarina_sp_Poly_1__7930@NODE_452_length_8287_cov_521_171290_g369_i0_p10_GENE_NODE_452_length_8287_cov_521_171290_g369_i0NODE_452_length_8287_cov_521_171290_g369_i0_p10_ORF_typecomplete_len104_score12_90_NODE_452_length_8287_cov_521_171290_g369_i016721983